jgi:hypothetical protein
MKECSYIYVCVVTKCGSDSRTSNKVSVYAPLQQKPDNHESNCGLRLYIRLVNNPASRIAGLIAGGLAALSQPARLYRKQGSSQPAEHQKPNSLIGLIV